MRKRTFAVSLLLLAVAVSATGPLQRGFADEPQAVRLGIAPLDYDGPFFDLTMAPGESRVLRVQVANHAREEIAARTYASDVYSIINGGFGTHLDGAETTGTTEWLTYQPATVALPGGQAITRSFSVTVPPHTEPGEYITSLVVQNAEATAAGSGNVAIKHIQRTVIAFVVTVPGERKPSLVIGPVEHKYAAKASIVSAVVSNTGNVRLKPSGELVLHDDRGKEVSRFTVAMDSVYSGDTTSIEVPLERGLLPGEYRLTLNLKHEGGAASVADMPFDVRAASELEAAGAPSGALTTAGVNQERAAGSGGRDIRLLGMAGGTALVLLLAMMWLGLRLGGRRPRQYSTPLGAVTSFDSGVHGSNEARASAPVPLRPSRRRALEPIALQPSNASPSEVPNRAFKLRGPRSSAANAAPDLSKLRGFAGQKGPNSAPGQRAGDSQSPGAD